MSLFSKTMKAVVWHGVEDIRLDDMPVPKIKEPTDAIVRLTASAICGTDLHFIRGTVAGMRSGTILGHEGVGVVEELADQVRNFTIGDRVVVCSTISCGTCSYRRAGDTAQCDRAQASSKVFWSFFSKKDCFLASIQAASGTSSSCRRRRS